jgi:hypothetical protein
MTFNTGVHTNMISKGRNTGNTLKNRKKEIKKNKPIGCESDWLIRLIS